LEAWNVSNCLQEACGFKTSGKRSQVYWLDREVHGDVCLAATGEFPIAGQSVWICCLYTSFVML